MTETENNALSGLKSLLMNRPGLNRLILFGSRARGDAEEYSDVDVVVIWDTAVDENTREYISECAWEAGFKYGLVIMPVVFSIDEWERGPERGSIFVQAVEKDGLILIP